MGNCGSAPAVIASVSTPHSTVPGTATLNSGGITLRLPEIASEPQEKLFDLASSTVPELRVHIRDLLSNLPSGFGVAPAISSGDSRPVSSSLRSSSSSEDAVRGLVVRISAALESLRASAEAARNKVALAASTACASGDADFAISIAAERDILLGSIDNAEQAKAAAFETELVAADEELERVMIVGSEAAAAAANPASEREELVIHIARLDKLVLLVESRPYGPVELPFIDTVVNTESGPLGVLCAPAALRAEHCYLQYIPRFARRGGALCQIVLMLNETSPSMSPEELALALPALASHVRAVASLERPPGSVNAGVGRYLPLSTALTPAGASSRCLLLSWSIPETTAVGSVLCISHVSVAGQPVVSNALPARVPVIRGGLAPPFVLPGAAPNVFLNSPAVSLAGVVYAPKYGASSVGVYGADGVEQGGLPLSSKISHHVVAAAFIESTGLLLLADGCQEGGQSALIAVDPASGTLRWAAADVSSFELCYAIAEFPSFGVVAVTSYMTNKIHVHRIKDGKRILSVVAIDPTCAVVDPATSMLYVSTTRSEVSAWHWNGSKLKACGLQAQIPGSSNHRLLAYMPAELKPSGGSLSSLPACLVVGTSTNSTINVYALPDLRHLGSHDLGFACSGVAGDPCGTALVVCNGPSKAIHALPWPLTLREH